MQERPILAPSILAADYTKLGNQIEQCIKAGTEWIHCDIMDGHFVPNISFGPSLVKAVRSMTNAFLDVHLMIEEPDEFIESFADAGANLLTVHQETCPHLHRTIQHIKDQNLKAGVAINPGTPLQQISPVLNDIDLVLIMSVNPGFGGQSFIESSFQRIQEMRAMREKYDASYLIEVDGGINPENIQKVAKAGANIFVTGSSVFNAADIPSQIKLLTKKAKIGAKQYV